MSWLRTPSFRVALLLNHAPIWVFTAGLLLGAPLALLLLHGRVADLGGLLAAGRLEEGQLYDLETLVQVSWFVCMSTFALFALGGSLVALWTHRVVARRLERLVDYARRRARGEDVTRPDVADAGVLGQLELAIDQVVGQIAQRDTALREEASRQRFDAGMQRALELVDGEEDVHELVTRAMAMVLPGMPFELMLADSSDAHLRRVGEGGPDGPPQCPVDQPRDCACVRRGKTLVFPSSEDLDACPRLRHHPGSPCSGACTPVSVVGKAIGVLHVTGEDGRPIDDDQVRALRGISTHAGTRIGVLRTLATTQLQAEQDPLTGLMNRRTFRTVVDRHLKDAGAGAFVMCDLDHFKRLNDTIGHEGGDRALQLFALTMKQVLRPTDVIGRWGGEEFALFLPGCDGATAAQAMERLRRALAEAVERSGPAVFTFSAGVAPSPSFGRVIDDLAREADAALYRAKQAGRDRTLLAGRAVVADEAAPTPPGPATRKAALELSRASA